MIRFSCKHGLGEPEARTRLEKTVAEVTARFGMMVKEVRWADDRRSVTVLGTVFTVGVRVDAQDVHVEGDIALLGGRFGGKVGDTLKQLIADRFKALPPGTHGR